MNKPSENLLAADNQQGRIVTEVELISLGLSQAEAQDAIRIRTTPIHLQTCAEIKSAMAVGDLLIEREWTKLIAMINAI